MNYVDTQDRSHANSASQASLASVLQFVEDEIAKVCATEIATRRGRPGSR